MPEQMKNSADWLGWSLQFIVGLVVGTVAGLMILLRINRHVGDLHLSVANFGMILCGTGLVGGGIASIYGDRLWLGWSCRVIPLDDISQSTASLKASYAACTLGCVIVVSAVIRHITIS